MAATAIVISSREETIIVDKHGDPVPPPAASETWTTVDRSEPARYTARITPAQHFCDLLVAIEENDTNYDERETLVAEAFYNAKVLGYKAGVRFDPAEPAWPTFVIDLPGVGEVSWHCPAFKGAYTGYTTEEKYKRARAFCSAISPTVPVVTYQHPDGTSFQVCETDTLDAVMDY